MNSLWRIMSRKITLYGRSAGFRRQQADIPGGSNIMLCGLKRVFSATLHKLEVPTEAMRGQCFFRCRCVNVG